MNQKLYSLKFTFYSLLIFCLSEQTLADDNNIVLPGNETKHLREAAKFRLEFSNDIIFQSDNLFTNGWSFQLHSPVAESWQTVDGPPDFIKDFSSWLPTLTADGLHYRTSISIGQIIQTPEDITDTNLITNDVPYAGVITLKSSSIAFNNTDFRGFEVVLGVLGRPSLAEQTQNFIHVFSGSDIPQGWNNQLKTEPVFNLNYMRKNKFYQTGKPADFSFDASISGDIQLGTLFTSTGIIIETRFGYNIPPGFAYRVDSIGRYLTYDASLAPAKSKQASIYGTLSLGTTYSAHNILMDGNVFKDTIHSVEAESFVGLLKMGFHYERPNWGMHFNINITTDVVDTDFVTANPDTENNFSSFIFEWKI